MNILAVGCHPDDLEIACAGTLSRYVKLGHKVFMCHVANGNKGHVIIMPDELGKIRAKEAEEASKIVGAEKCFNLDVGDLEVNSNDPELINNMIDVIRYCKPDVIITHNPDDYMKDHMEVSKLVFDASFGATVPHKFTKYPYFSKLVPIYYMDTLAGVNFLPTEYVDISDTIEIKLKALACHDSQIKWMLEHDKIDFIDYVRTTSKFRGLQCGVAYAEGFKRCYVTDKVDTKRYLP